jgi:hypothetical protein
MKRELLRKPSVRIVAALATLSVLVIAPALVFAGPLVFHGAAQAGALSASSPRVTHDTHHDVSAPLSSIQAGPSRRSGKTADDFAPLAPRRQGAPNNLKAPVQTAPGTLAIPATATNFDGVGNGFTGPNGTFTVAAAPPDTNGAVGPNNYVQLVNTDFAIFNKTGTVLKGPLAINSLWSGFGGLCQTDNDGDPTVVYDRAANRWIIAQFAITGANGTSAPFLQCVAVSTTGDPTGSYNRYSFSYPNFPDYPKMAVWPDAYYETYNMFNAAGTSFLGAEDCAFDRSKMLTGAAATQQCFQTSTSFGGLLPSNLDSSIQPAAGSPNYVIGLNTTTSLAFWKFHVDFATPANSTFTGPTSLAVASYAQACGGGTCIPQSGTTQQLDSLADRVMFRFGYRKFADGHESLVVNHSVTAGSSVGVRWYEIRLDANHNPSIFQQATYAPDASFRWMGSIAMDGSGDIGMGFSTSSSSLHPGLRYTGRLAGDALNTMSQGEGTIITGAGSQTGQSLSRWGDYSAMTVDPSDDCTFWYTNEYIPANGAFNWKTRIGSFKFAGCGGTATNDFSISASPTSLSLGANASGTSTISTATTAGTAQTVNLTVSGTPAGATASLSPTSVTSGGSATLTVNAGTAAAGTYTLTVTGTGTSATHTATVTLTVTAANDFSISASPTSLSLAANTSGTSTISTATTSGAAQTVNLTVSGTPAGATASLSPTSVTSGGSATLTVNAGTAAAGTYTLTVTGTGTTTHSTTVSLTVTAGGTTTNLIVNGGFESGQSPWVETSSGGFQLVDGTNPHTGTQSAFLCGYNNCTDTIRQTVTLPSTTTKVVLTFWLFISTSETTTTTCFDNFNARIRTSTGTVITTPLTQCNLNHHGWQQFSFDVTSALSSFKGQQIQVFFSGTTDVSLISSFFVDDVALNVTA